MVEEFMVEKSGVERSGFEAWVSSLGLKSPGLKCPSTANSALVPSGCHFSFYLCIFNILLPH